jgi:hypothetical protein
LCEKAVENCPTSWRGAFQGAGGKASIVLEAVASYDLHIWHAFIGVPGSNNDLNVLDASPILDEYLADDAVRVSFEVNGRSYNSPYWLADGIYPDYRCFVKTFSAPIGEKQALFAKAQEAIRKDVERAFGVLQARFSIVASPAKHWKLKDIRTVWRCCIILHNMIVEDDRRTGRIQLPSHLDYTVGRRGDEAHVIRLQRFEPSEMGHKPYLEKYSALVGSSTEHCMLKRDLVEHHWNMRS